MISSRGEVYIVNESGPMTEPCCTPSRDVCGLEIELLITIDCERFMKYDENQFKTELVSPYLLARRSRNILWLIVSKAAE